MSTDACCICSSLLGTFDRKSEKAIISGHSLPCCARAICTRCISNNQRYSTYCPYCQISTGPNLLPQRLRDPPPYYPSPPYSSPAQTQPDALVEAAPPAYPSHAPIHTPLSEKPLPVQDVLHFLQPSDSMTALSLAYGVPLPALRECNRLHSDRLLPGRKTLLIPGRYYKGGISLSPTPVGSEEEEWRKNGIRRWMVACKCADYEVAVLYVEQSGGGVDEAVQAYQDDERWERENPLYGRGEAEERKRRINRGKSGGGMRWSFGTGSTD